MSKSILLDTHIYIWLRACPERLSPAERRLIDGAVIRYVSAVSLWEIALLMGLGRIDQDARLFTPPDGIDLLPVEPGHCQALLTLPPVHRDPFDRMLIAQARTDRLTLVTRDTKIREYDVAD